MMDNIITKADQVIDAAVKCFLERVNAISENGPFRKVRKMPTTFSMLRPANDEYYEYAYFERTLEWYIRVLLINSILHGLFKNHGIDTLWFDANNYARFSTESIENIYPFEFIILSDKEKVGVRYTSLCAGETEGLIKKHKITRIVQVKWSDDVTSREKGREEYEVVSPEAFFTRYFTQEEYRVFISRVMPAIEKANAEIGFETIPRLSLRYLSNFKAAVNDELSGIQIEKMRFQILPGSKDKKRLGEKNFSAQDYKTLRDNFVNRGLYKALLGTEDFAKCFITAEYQYQVFKQGHSFDYTSVVCGYLKAVEQLIYKLLLINLSHPSKDKLWIMKNGGNIPKSKYIPGITVRSNPETGKLQVAFEEDFKKFFNITLAPMIWFLHDNINGWEISDNGRLTVHSFLLNFADECRNDYFHKDNIKEFEAVIRIRNNTIMIMFLLLGGYKLTGNHQEDVATLGIADDSFDRMYKKIQELPSGMCKFILYYPEKEPIKMYRHFVQEQTVYDENGSVASSRIKFVVVDKFSGDEYDKAIQGEYADREFSLDRNNMPTKVSYINGRNEELFIKW